MVNKNMENIILNIREYLEKELKINLNEQEMNYIYNLGAKKSEIGDFQNALPLFQFLALYDGKSSSYVKAVAGCHQGLEQFDQAVFFFHQAYLLEPQKNIDCVFYEGYCYLRINKRDLAKEYLTLFLELQKDQNELTQKAKLLLRGLE